MSISPDSIASAAADDLGQPAQTHYRGATHCIRTIIKEQGLMGLYVPPSRSPGRHASAHAHPLSGVGCGDALLSLAFALSFPFPPSGGGSLVGALVNPFGLRDSYFSGGLQIWRDEGGNATEGVGEIRVLLCDFHRFP